MLQNRWDQSLSPGNLSSRSTGAARPPSIPGTRNYMGAKDPAIDALIATLLEARERPAFISAVRALDRTLMSGFRYSAVCRRRAMDRAMGSDRKAEEDIVDRLSAGNLVAEAGPATEMI